MASGSVLIGLQGGGACHDLEECTRRCEEDGVPLCSSKNARDQIQMGGRASVWSPLPEENPAFLIGTRCGCLTAAATSTRETE